MRRFRSQAGESLIGVIVAVALVVLAATAFVKGMTGYYQTKQRVESNQFYRIAEDTILRKIVSIVGGYFPVGAAPIACATKNFTTFQALWSTQVIAPLGMDIRLIDSSNDTKLDTYTGDTSHDLAKARCKASQTLKVAGDTLAGKNAFYFCLLFERQNVAVQQPPESIFENDHAFMEVSFHLRNATSNNPLTCEQVITSNYPVSIIAYTMYWRKKVPVQGFTYNSWSNMRFKPLNM